MRFIVQIAVLTGTLVVGRVPVTLAQQSDAVPVATGVVATITSLDSRTGLATLTTTAGEGFQVPKEGSCTPSLRIIRSAQKPAKRL